MALTDDDLCDSFCFYCGGIWEEYGYYPNSEDTENPKANVIEADCPECGSDVVFGEPSCPDCQLELDAEFWRDWYDQYWMDLSVDFDSPNIIHEPIQLTEYHNICCDRFWQQCDCIEPIAWEDHYNILPEQNYEAAYSQTTECSQCIHWYKASCKPFRSWIKTHFATREFPGSIDDICDDFDSYINYENDFVPEPLSEETPFFNFSNMDMD